MYSLLKKSNIPKWLKLILYILLTLTCIYWLGVLIYKFLSALRKFLHWATDERNWWTFLVCILILVIGSLLISQFCLGLDPFGKLVDWIVGKWNDLRNWIGGVISGN